MSREPVDIEVGRLVARRRRIVGLSQSALAQRIGVSFQQVQKYETGANRVSASRLFNIAEILGVGVADLFPVAHWTAEPDTSRERMEECARLLDQVRPALDQAARIIRGAS